MRINDEFGNYHGWYIPQTGMFTQACEKVEHKAVRIPADVNETLRVLGCRFIETSIEYDHGHIEAFYITYDRFLEMATNEWNHDCQTWDIVYHIHTPIVQNERMEVRSNLY